MGERGGMPPFGWVPGRGEPQVDESKLLEFVRRLVKKAHERTSLKFIYELAAASGWPLQTKEETLRKFIREEGRGFDNKDDLMRLARVFTMTPIGSAFVAPLRTTVTGGTDEEIRLRFFGEFLKPAGAVHLTLSKRYLVFHSSFFESNAYSIRFMRIIKNDITGQIAFEDSKSIGHALRVMEGPALFLNYGIVQYFMGKPHFVSTDPISDVGSRLIVIDRWIIDTGDAQVLVGRMSGMSNVGGSYIKDVLLYKFDGSDHDGHRQSGNFSLSSMGAYQRARFKDLARMRPRDLSDLALDALLDDGS